MFYLKYVLEIKDDLPFLGPKPVIPVPGPKRTDLQVYTTHSAEQIYRYSSVCAGKVALCVLVELVRLLNDLWLRFYYRYNSVIMYIALYPKTCCVVYSKYVLEIKDELFFMVPMPLIAVPMPKVSDLQAYTTHSADRIYRYSSVMCRKGGIVCIGWICMIVKWLMTQILL